MSGKSAAQTLLQIKASALAAAGEELTESEKVKLLQKIEANYNEQLSPYYAAARLWVDEIIDPINTRSVISTSLAFSSMRTIPDEVKTGVIQT